MCYEFRKLYTEVAEDAPTTFDIVSADWLEISKMLPNLWSNCFAFFSPKLGIVQSVLIVCCSVLVIVNVDFFLLSVLFWGVTPNLKGFLRLFDGFETSINWRITWVIWWFRFSDIGIKGSPSSITQKFWTSLKWFTESGDLAQITTESEIKEN